MQKILKRVATAACVGLFTLPLAAQPVGQWDFDSGTLAGTVGGPLEYVDGPGGATAQATQFGTTTALGVPDIGGQPGNVMRFPANPDATRGYRMPVAAPANGGGQFVNEWTVLMDLLFPATSQGVWRGLMETDGRLINEDADLFVNTANQLGIGSYFGAIQANTWHRIAMVVNTPANTLTFYIDGVRVGSRDAGGGTALDGRWALTPSGVAELFNDNDGEVAVGYVNSIQLRGIALSDAQVAALGTPTAAGIPQVIPPIPAYVTSVYPSSGFARPNDKIGWSFNRGDANVTAVSFRIDGNAVTPTVVSNGLSLTIEVANRNFAPQTDHTAILSFTDSVAGARNFTNTFRIPVFYEDFDLLVLGPSVDPALGGEPNTREAVWTNVPPVGWTIDNSQMPPQSDPPSGRPEWEGWSFADVKWWSTFVDTQLREQFTKARGAAAIADPDEWDDYGNPDGTRGYFKSYLLTPTVTLPTLAANTLFLRFDSSWRPEGFDDAGPDGQSTNNQTAVVTISYNGGASTEVLRFDSQTGGPFFHADNVNETVTLPLNNPANATSISVTFALLHAGNDWWWAVDNIVLDAGAVPPTITQQPADLAVLEDDPAVFTVAASGSGPFSYQWFKGQGTNKVAIAGATSTGYTNAQPVVADAGFYSVEVRNAAGTSASREARLTVSYRYGQTALLSEDFNGLALGPNVDEGLAGDQVWTKTPPAGWSVDDSGVPGAGDPSNDGVTEWAGWSFADRVWWATTAGDQQRTQFTKGTGAVAVADGDEWDDQPRAAGLMNTFLKTPAISLAGIRPNSVRLAFDSSWRPEPIQKAVITASYNGGAPVEVLRWESENASPNYHTDSVNESVLVPVNNPAGATNVVFSFGYIDAGNNWWWAVDNIVVTGARSPIFFEDFNGLALGPNVEEGITTGSGGATNSVWTKTPPTGWAIDDSQVPGVGTTTNGVVEWAGWSFADRAWWAFTCGDQQRTRFTKSTGAAAIADGDEWDDLPRLPGQMSTFLSTPEINITGQAANTLLLRFSSSWRDEVAQKANITVSYNGGAAVEVLRWQSDPAQPNFHDDNPNETVTVPLHNPAGAATAKITFGYLDAGNNWWWALDNIEVNVGEPSTADLGTLAATRSGSNLNFTWTGGPGIRLQKTGSLTAPVTWTDVAGTEGASAATEAIGTGIGFYRLFKP